MSNPNDPTEFEIARATRIDPKRLDDEFCRLPADLAYWNARYADAQEELLNVRRNLEKLEAMLRREYRGSLIKPTEAAIGDAVAVDERYIVLREREDAAEVAKTRLTGVTEALRAKREMLISIGANARAEFKSYGRSG
jgi:hypothetical protein